MGVCSPKTAENPHFGVDVFVLADIKRIEVDERIDPDDTRIIAILDKMLKQRRESIKQYESGGRQDLADQESFEISVLQEFLPTALEPAELEEIVKSAIADTGAESIKDMGKVMGIVKPKVIGRADMGIVSAQIKSLLG